MNAAPLTGYTLGTYRLGEKIGQGGMGAVYAGEHAVLGRKVAIKVLLSEVSSDPIRTRRFFNEARAAAQIRHPGIVDVLDFGTGPDGRAYLVMEFLDGESLATRLKRGGALSEATARRFARQMAGALAAAHARQIIHRDLKPDNLFIVPDDGAVGGERIKVLDFGVAKLQGENDAAQVDTGTGAVVGSPGYMAPEQARGTGPIDERTDVYALGCVLFEMVCGRRPFVATGYGEVLSMHMHDPPPPPRSCAPGLSAELEQLILRALAKLPGERPASMEAFVAALGAMPGGTPDPSLVASMEYASANASTVPPTRVSGEKCLGPTLTASQMEPSGPPAAGVSTTLGSSAAEATSAAAGPGRRRKLLAVGAVVVVAGAAAAIAFISARGPTVPGRGAGPTGATTAPSAAFGPPAPADAAVLRPDAAPAPPPPPDAAPAPAVIPAPDAAPPPRTHRNKTAHPKVQRGELIDE
jgi:serine/threonine protein kinase